MIARILIRRFVDISWLFYCVHQPLRVYMASKEQIQKHLSLSSNIKLSPNVPDEKGQAARKIRIMEHVKRSKG